jgi:C4-type Zn-finger protein
MGTQQTEETCPICGNDGMRGYQSNRPFFRVGAECKICGFCYYTDWQQMSLENLNYLREDYNEENNEEIEIGEMEKLKRVTMEEYDKWGPKIGDVMH